MYPLSHGQRIHDIFFFFFFNTPFLKRKKKKHAIIPVGAKKLDYGCSSLHIPVGADFGNLDAEVHQAPLTVTRYPCVCYKFRQKQTSIIDNTVAV